jgi:hypothetical protein
LSVFAAPTTIAVARSVTTIVRSEGRCGASHNPPAVVTITMKVIRGFVRATRSRTIAVMLAGRATVVIRKTCEKRA